ncbi:hypothetical protein EV199_2551 [Pseudobacter ginsenosidimutans]|uniref:Uncharacterized protein n=1 Tax=Pseudobacter ginsenosidimutans TaxID=661488 RepID=A0A4Q7MQM7_9BACT|nr:hypothetical protein EV199_2551 [Pseudobacter ginsenosidimutans]
MDGRSDFIQLKREAIRICKKRESLSGIFISSYRFCNNLFFLQNSNRSFYIINLESQVS